MKRQSLYILLLVILPLAAFAQWTNVGPNIVNINAGNVGVGNNNPSFKLDVEGFGHRVKNSSAAYNAYTTLRLQGPSYANGLEIDFFGNNNMTNDPNWSYGGGPGSVSIANVNPLPLTLATNNIGRVLIDGAGNVGIGTFTPDSKLTVNGKIKAEEIEVVVDVPADYVFEPSYRLMPLSEVSAYIRKNKHLPNVPSAAELKEEGWNVGKMNNKLLEKIEELTLYLLEMKKEQSEMLKRIKNLEERK